MKITRITKYVSLFLVVGLTIFGVAVSWSLHQLNKSFSIVAYFGQQKELINHDIRQPIFNYLHNGDAMLLPEIAQRLNQIKADIDQHSELQNSLKTPLLDILNDIQKSTLPELAADGKLAEPQMLLITNEQQLSGHLHTLLNYVGLAQAAALNDRFAYLQAIAQTQSALQNLSRVRQSLFVRQNSQVSEGLQHNLRQLIKAGESIQNLPLLGVLSKSTNNEPVFTLGASSVQKTTEDMAVEPKSEISSLLSR